MPDDESRSPDDETQSAAAWSDETHKAAWPADETRMAPQPTDETQTPRAWSDETQTGGQWSHEPQTGAQWSDETRVTAQWSDDSQTELIATSKPGWRRPGLWALIAGVVAVVLATVLVVVWVVDRDSANPAAQQGEVFLEPTSSTGLDPFSSDYSTKQPPTPEDPGPPPATPASSGGVIPTVDGGQPGNFGGSMNLTTCDAEGLITYLEKNPDKARAWASVFKIQPEQIPAFIRELTPVLLRADTRVTNHGYSNGGVVARQSVLEAGTAVLVNEFGEPAVRCYCGNPLLPPIAQQATPAYKPVAGGYVWKNFKPETIMAVKKSAAEVNIFRLWDPWLGAYFWRYRGIRIADLPYDPNVQPPPEPPPAVAPSTPPPPPPPPPTYAPTTTYYPPTTTHTTTSYPPTTPPTTTSYPPTTTYTTPTTTYTTTSYPQTTTHATTSYPPTTRTTYSEPPYTPDTPPPQTTSYVPPRLTPN